jgi:hypothetical protein
VVELVVELMTVLVVELMTVLVVELMSMMPMAVLPGRQQDLECHLVGLVCDS